METMELKTTIFLIQKDSKGDTCQEEILEEIIFRITPPHLSNLLIPTFSRKKIKNIKYCSINDRKKINIFHQVSNIVRQEDHLITDLASLINDLPEDTIYLKSIQEGGIVLLKLIQSGKLAKNKKIQATLIDCSKDFLTSFCYETIDEKNKNQTINFLESHTSEKKKVSF